jgi:hypothetical protein
MAVMTGTGLVIVNGSEFEAQPFDDGLDTATVAPPGVPTSAAEMLAVSTVLLTKLVARAAPFQYTVAPGTNDDPVTAKPNPPPPATPLVGLSPVMAGTGLEEAPSIMVTSLLPQLAT